jgi:small conductance mechanosensitive channel
MQAPAADAPAATGTVEVIAALAIALVIAGALALVAGGLMRRFLTRLDADRVATGAVRKAAVRAVRLLTFVVAMAVLAFPALEFAGVTGVSSLRGEELARWIGRVGARIGVILLLVTIANRAVAALIGRAERELAPAGASPAEIERQKRAHTIGRTLSRFLSIVIWSAGLLMILRTLDVDITPVLTGAGILGLAVGFGAQTLVKDVISGFFLILEDQVRVGDVALVNGIGGAVEQINLRTLVMRDVEGTVHIIPNGEVRTLANRSKDYAYFVLDLGIDYHEDVDRAIDAVKAAFDELNADAAFAPRILEPLEVQGVNDFTASAVTLRFRVKTIPLAQWDVGRELRRRVKRALDTRGIQIPFPQMALSYRKGPEDSDQAVPRGNGGQSL